MSDEMTATRTEVLRSTISLVENLRRGPEGPSEGFSPRYQVCLPYRGFFVWHVGSEDVVADANQILFVAAGEAYRVTQPLAGGFAELIITPDIELLTELAGVSEARLRSHALFMRRGCRSTFGLQRMCARLLHHTTHCADDTLATEEMVLAILRSSFQQAGSDATRSAQTRRLVRRAKEFVESNLTGPVRLVDVARAVGVSPAHLTTVFHRAEGVPLHKYVVQLRLARALVELPHSSDLTTLALDLGFSSHSHFAATFRRSFGCTPSAFRGSRRLERNWATIVRPALKAIAVSK